MPTFITMVNRIASELRRSNLTDEIKQAINDAIEEASNEHFYFNEIETTFDTVAGNEYYENIMGVVEVDYAYELRTDGSGRDPITWVGDFALADDRLGNNQTGRPELLGFHKGQFRIAPVPSDVRFIFVSGYGRLSNVPITADGATSPWLSEAELYIRALAKSILLRDVIRDYGEAKVLENIAENQKQKLLSKTNLQAQTGYIRSTQF